MLEQFCERSVAIRYVRLQRFGAFLSSRSFAESKDDLGRGWGVVGAGLGWGGVEARVVLGLAWCGGVWGWGWGWGGVGVGVWLGWGWVGLFEVWYVCVCVM